MSGPRIGELFAGYGGLGMGVQAVYGGEIAWVSEFDKGPSKILTHRFPGVPNHGDITTIDWSQVEPVDILTGGSPCQDLSAAGKRKGMTEGTRSNLWVAMREAIAQLRPALVVWENVRGAGSAEADSDLEFCPGCMGDAWYRGPVLRALGRVVGDLADLGYVGSVRGIRAADVGSCHGRFRYFVLAQDASAAIPGSFGRDGREAQLDGAPGLAAGDGSGTLLPSPRTSDTNGAGRHGEGGLDLRTAISLLPTPTCGDAKSARNSTANRSKLPPTGIHDGHTLIDAVTLLPTPTTRDHKDHTIRREPHRPDDIDTLSRAFVGLPAALLPTPAVNDMGAAYTPETWDQWTAKMKAAHGNGNGHGASLNIEPQRLAAEPQPDACCPAYGQSWVTSEDVDYGPAIRRWHDLTRCTPAPTEVGGKGGRRLNPAFSEWMMGLPAGWVTDVPGITRNEALKALGNGVVPPQAAAALRTMLAWSEVAA